MRRHRLLLFFLLTFGISWGVPGLLLLVSSLTDAVEVNLAAYSPLYYLAVWAPAIAAFATIGVTQGRVGIRAYLGRLLHWRAGVPWYLLILLGVPIINLGASLLTQLAGRPALVVPGVPWHVFVLSALLLATAGPMEEIGWRGFALPLLQQRMSGLRAALILGLIWGLWHFPAVALGGFLPRTLEDGLLLHMGGYLVGCVASSIILAVIYNATGGSIPLAFLYHWMTNFPYPWEGEVDISNAQTLLYAVAALALIIAFRRRYLGRDNLYTDVTPGIPPPR